MSRIVFDDQRPSPAMNLARADVACFVGLVRLAGNVPLTAIPGGLLPWLTQQAWIYGPFAKTEDKLLSLLDLPVLIESFADFVALFDPGSGVVAGSASGPVKGGTDYLAAAVRSFFAQGGRRCYVIRMGDPIAHSDDPASLLKALTVNDIYAADDQSGWSGATHLAGLPEVSFLLMPDLPVLSSSLPPALSYAPSAAATGPEQFVECSVADLTPSSMSTYSAPAPTLAPKDYARWAGVVASVLQYISTSAREVQFVAAMPLPQTPDIATSADAPAGSPALLAADIHDVLLALFDEKGTLPAGLAPRFPVPGDATPQSADLSKPLPPSLSTAFLQLGYPWLKTTGSYVLLQSLEPPDGALAGILARNALTRGTFTSATKISPSEVFDVWPSLPIQETLASDQPLVWGKNSPKPLIERLSLFGFTPAGMRLLSDVTASAGESYRAASVNRLVSVISRASRQLGEELVFGNSGPGQWAKLESSLRKLMTALWKLNALDGAAATDAFSVRCDRSTMTQNDIDNGRFVAIVTFTAASTIELIRVTLAIEPAGAAVPSQSFVLAGVA